MKLFKSSLFKITISIIVVLSIYLNVVSSLKLNNQYNNNIQHLYKVQPSVHKYFDDQSRVSHKLWVFFNTKNYQDDVHRVDNIVDHDSLSETQHINRNARLLKLSESALERRSRRSPNLAKSVLDQDDLPVQSSLIKSVLQCSGSIKVHQTSKWLNAISISIDLSSEGEYQEEFIVNDIINCITSHTFVEKIDLVRKFSKKPVDNIENHNANSKVHRIEKSADKQQQQQFKSLKDEDGGKAFYNNTYEDLVQVNAVKAMDLGLNGKGLIILILDSGFLTSHDAFKNLTIIDTYDFIHNQTNVTEPFGSPSNRHGTATLSTLAAYLPGLMIGPAYNATFLLGKTEDVNDEYIQEEDFWIRGIEWGESKGAELVSSSLGYTLWYKYYDMNGSYAQITLAADKAVAKGMVVVNSAGNEGTAGIGAPADGFSVIAVGALELAGNATSFTSQGPTADGRVKPDIAARGYKNFVADSTCDECYTLMSGTSFACPLSAGAIALVMQQNRNWTAQQVYQAVTTTASQYTKPDILKGYGILNTFDALNFKPTAANVTCDTFGCSGHGGCCNSTCYCAPDYYGEFCQHPKQTCGTPCTTRGGTCGFDQYGYSFVCTQNSKSYEEPTNTCKVCDGKFDECGICGGANVCKEKKDNKDDHHDVKVIVGATLGSAAALAIIISIVVYFRYKKINHNPYRQIG